MRKIFFFIGFLICFGFVKAQELNCDVQVVTPKLQVADPAIFEALENSIFEFINNRKWTDDVYQNYERIDCKLIITITEELSADRFKANATIQSSRPVFNSDYKTVVFNYSDKEWEFQYSQYQPIDYNDNTFISNLSSLLAYYAYIMIALDYDSFSPEGGTPYFLKAQSIVNSAQSVKERGWKSYEGLRNRYWLVENFLNKKYDPFRNSFYAYHRLGLDEMYAKKPQATSTITNGLYQLVDVEKDNPSSMIMQLFFAAKSDELIDIYNNAAPPEKTKALNALIRLDAANSEKYQNILRK